MRKAALLYNPDSGGSRRRRESELNSVLAILDEGGVDATLIPAHSRAHAEEKARQAMLAGCDTIFACGGDGTIHNIIQVLANTPVALAVLPMGTANALAHDLGLPMNIAGAAKSALRGTPRRVALGQIRCQDFSGKACSRYFVIAAGMGVDAALFHALTPETKRRMGMTAYYAKAWHLWFSYAMTRFQVEYSASETGFQDVQCVPVTEIMAVRIRNFGGVLKEFAPGASLDRGDVRLILCRTASRLAYLAYVTRGLLRLNYKVPGIDLVHAGKAVCQTIPSPDGSSPAEIYVEADGELLGTLPAEISMVPHALTIVSSD
ncbi:MAG: diacylglycerol kinase family protein [Candidatus Sulfotelmatobacter sp.]|jgi:diacylglycerol kinase (ATP)